MKRWSSRRFQARRTGAILAAVLAGMVLLSGCGGVEDPATADGEEDAPALVLRTAADGTWDCTVRVDAFPGHPGFLDDAVRVLLERFRDFPADRVSAEPAGGRTIAIRVRGIEERLVAQAEALVKTPGNFGLHLDRPAPADSVPDDCFPACDQDGNPLLLETVPKMAGDGIRSVHVKRDLYGKSVLFVEFDGAGRSRFEELTRENVGRRLAFVFDGVVLAAPVIQEPVAGGLAVVPCRAFSREEEVLVSRILSAGMLPGLLSIEREAWHRFKTGSDFADDGADDGRVQIDGSGSAGEAGEEEGGNV